MVCNTGLILEEPSRDLEQALLRLKSGEVVAYPTETFFGLAVDPANESAVDELLKIKTRHLNEGISLIASSHDVINRLAVKELYKEKRLALQQKFWPGALTLVIDLEIDNLPFSKKLLAADGSIALRVSSSSCARDLAEKTGGLITATSANPHGLAPARTAKQAREYFPRLFVIEGHTDSQMPSTIVDTRKNPFQIIREGEISLEKLRPYL